MKYYSVQKKIHTLECICQEKKKIYKPIKLLLKKGKKRQNFKSKKVEGMGTIQTTGKLTQENQQNEV